MYKEFYGLTTYPFTLNSDPRFLYLSETHENCLLHLVSSLEREYGFIVLIGEIGTGKTLMLHSLVQKLGENSQVAFLVNSRLDSKDILQYASHELRLEIAGKSKAELLIDLKRFLLQETKATERVVLIVDEAHHLSVEVLEELRLLTNFETFERKLLQVILVGQPLLEKVLQLPELAQLHQRIGFKYRLLPMNAPETKGYIEKRLAVAGVKDGLFTSAAIDAIFAYTQGVPRVINIVCDLALFFGYADEEPEIRPAIIKQVIESFNIHAPKNPAAHDTSPQRASHGTQTSTMDRVQRIIPPVSAPSPAVQSTERLDRRPTWSGFRCPRRLALVVGMAVVSLCGVGILWWGWLGTARLSAYTARLLPPPLMVSWPWTPSSRQPRVVQWAPNTVSHQLPLGKPFTVSLPALQNTVEGSPVEVTLDMVGNTPGWLQFDPEKLHLSGVAPRTGAGKTYTLTFRARTTNSIDSLLQLHLTLTQEPH